MDRRIYVDIGNSRIKASLWRDGRFDPKVVHLDSVGDFHKWYDDHRLGDEKVIVASVVKSKLTELKQSIHVDDLLILNNELIPKRYLDYNTPHTLGIDRFLTCLGAYSQTHSSVIAIDAGTACTIDYMDENKVFHGGVIMPGLRTIHRALNNYAPELPQTDLTLPKHFPGRSSVDSVKWGTNGLVKAAIQHFIKNIKDIDANAAVLLTGGDANTLSDLLDSDHKVDQNLLFNGMKLFCDLFID